MSAVHVAILDYGAGNVRSVARAFRHVGASVQLTSDQATLAGADAIVVPGVGHFRRTAAIAANTRRGIVDAAGCGVPLLGICLGMHWLFEGSAEAPECDGLGVLPGRCGALAASAGIKVPHVGWNELEAGPKPSRLLDGIGRKPHAYFCHSYAVRESEAAAAVSRHGDLFAAAVERDSVFGVQFHPEKSGEVGLLILRNFLRVAEARC
jgi:glutamine amidotransferase